VSTFPTDVLIVGAGPVGLAMASELARFGLSVRIVDKSAARTDESKALVVWPRTLELFDRSGAGQKLLAAGRTCPAANLMSGAKTLAHVDFAAVQSPHPYALMIPQSETERVLEEHGNLLGVTVERSTELISFTQTDGGVSCTLRRAGDSPSTSLSSEAGGTSEIGGSIETVDAAWLIACDGAHSTLRHQLDLEFKGDTLPTDWMLADVHLSGLSKPEEMYIFLHHEGALAIFPIGEASTTTATPRTRVIANVGTTDPNDKRSDPTLDQVQAVLDARGTGSLRASDPVWLSNFTINERKIADYRHGRVFFAGDAAHIHSPAGGQGMNTGIQDAMNLAWKLALVQRKLCSNRELLLSSYSAERSPIAEDVLKSTGQLTSLATMENSALLAMRNTAVSLVLGFGGARHAMAEKLTELDIAYKQSPLSKSKPQARHQPAPGERYPIHTGSTAPVGGGDTPRFALFAEAGNDAEQFLKCFPAVLEAEARAPLAPGTLTLVRPDGYVAYSGDSASYREADAYMTELIYGPMQKVSAP
jgi:2-polyprenyl-6-methoxyphenol hydroxylase-like FAD-dependent oxidoreductase